MASTTLTPNSSATSTNSAVPIKPYNETYRAYAKLTADGKIDEKEVKVTSSGQENKIWAKLEADGYQLGLEQTLKLYEVGTLEGAKQLITDEEELVNLINRGIAQKLGQKLKGLLSEVNSEGTAFVFNPQPEPYDMVDLLNAETKRRNLSPLDKATKGLKEIVKMMNPSFNDEQVTDAVLKLLAQAQGGA